MMTDAQLRAEANRRVNDLLNPQIQQQEREAQQRAATIQAASDAAAKILQSHVGMQQDIYRNAAQDVAGFGGQLSDAAKARIQGAQDAAAQFAQSQGATQTQGTDPNAVHDTTYWGGVGIPGSSLESQGATAASLATAQSGLPALQGQQDIRQSQQDKEKALLDLAAQRPELTDKVLSELYANEMNKVKLNIQQQASDLYASQFGEKVRHDVATEKLSKLRYQEQVRVHNNAIQQAAAAGHRPNASLSKAYGYIVDAQGNPILDHNGNKIPVVRSQSSNSVRAKEKAQYGKAVGEAAKMWQDSQPKPNPNAPNDPTLATPPKRKWSWGQAMNYLMARFGIKRARARAALIHAGFTPPSGVNDPTRGTGRG